MPKYPNASIRSIAVTISLAGLLAVGIAFTGGPAAARPVVSQHAPRHSQHAPHRVPRHVPRHSHRRPARHRKPRRPAARHLKPRQLTARQLARRGRWQLRIPGIGVRARLLSLGDPHGPALSVPSLSQSSEAAWYNFSAVPGRPGNAVLVGHVDTYTGPAVFYNLYLLRHGDPVYVSVGGRPVRFAVDGVTEVPKDLFPVNRIFGATRGRHLWIITCGGPFDYLTRHYTENIIVSASYQPAHRNSPANASHHGKRLP